MATDPLNIGPCQVEYDGTSIGLMKDGASVAYDEETVITTADVTGNTARKKIIIGQSLKVTGAVTEVTLAQIAAMLGATVVEGATKDEVRIVNRVGEDLIDSAAELVLKPVVQGVVSVATDEWFYVPKATLIPVLAVAYKFNEQKQWGFEFEGHPLLDADVASGADWDGGEYVTGQIAAWGRLDS